MLDTDSVSFALRGHGNVGDRLLKEKPSGVCMSSITLAELRFGAEAKGSRKLRSLIDRFSDGVSVVPFDGEAAVRFGVVAAALARKGTPIGALDTLIAAHALSLKATLVTNNTKHFQNVAGLKLENWL